MTLHPKCQSFEAPQDKKTVERSRDRPDRILQKRNLISQFRVLPNNDDASHQIRMAVQIFRCRMNDNVEAGFNGSLDPWSSERVIANRNQFAFPRNLGDRLEID